MFQGISIGESDNVGFYSSVHMLEMLRQRVLILCNTGHNTLFFSTLLLCHCSCDTLVLAAEFFTLLLFERAMLWESHLSVYWYSVGRHILCGSLAGLIAHKSPVLQECNYLLTQIILLAGSQCLCSGRVTPGTESSHNLALTPRCNLTSKQTMIFFCVFVCKIDEWRFIYYRFVLSVCNVSN